MNIKHYKGMQYSRVELRYEYCSSTLDALHFYIQVYITDCLKLVESSTLISNQLTSFKRFCYIPTESTSDLTICLQIVRNLNESQ